MKKILAFTLAIICVLSVASCSPQDTQTPGSDAQLAVKQVGQPKYPESIGYEDYEKQDQVLQNNPIDESFIKSLNNFAFNSASQLIAAEEKNSCYSPISLYYALSLAATGAAQDTQSEMLSTLQMQGKDASYMSAQMGNLYRALYKDNEIGKLKIANSLWMQHGIAFKDDFVKNAVDSYYSAVFNVDFGDANTPEQISQWISDNTAGLIKPKISVDKDHIMSIINTVYFKDEWYDKFPEDLTKQDTFTTSKGEKVQCNFMNATKISSYAQAEGFKSISLPMKNQNVMHLVLPDQDMTIAKLLASAEKLSLISSTPEDKSAELLIKLPKFSFDSSYDLIELLKTLGVQKAFDAKGADFSNLTDVPAYISTVKQDAHIAIDEKGAEAAAYTEVGMRTTGMMETQEKLEMYFNRPFIYYITSSGGAILFIGVVQNPTLK